VALAALVVWASLAVPAVADERSKAPEYSLSVVEGADTQPEDSIGHVSARVNTKAEVAVSITHNGLVVDKQSGEGGAFSRRCRRSATSSRSNLPASSQR
jgi:hypothetical protein